MPRSIRASVLFDDEFAGSRVAVGIQFQNVDAAGEFRWVSAKYLNADYPRNGVRKAPPAEKHSQRHDRHDDDETADLPSGSSAPLIPALAVSSAAWPTTVCSNVIAVPISM